MIINNNFKINVLPQKQQTKPTFKAAHYFQPIKESSKMICACCGQKTLPVLKYMQVMTRLGLPLKAQIEKGALDYLKDNFPKTWEMINLLSEEYPLQSLDKIIHGYRSKTSNNYVELKETVVADIEANENFRGLYPFAKNKLIRETFFDLNDNARTYMQPSSAVIDMITPLTPYLNETKKEFYEQLKKYAHKYPNKSLSEIVRDPEIAEFHRKNLILQDEKIRKKRYSHFRNILMMIEESNPLAVEAFQKLQNQAFKIVYTEKDENKKEYILKSLYKEALTKYHCNNLKEEDIFEELKHISKNNLTIDYYFVQAFNNNYSDGKIVNLLFEDILASKKDIIQNDIDSQNKFGNHYVMCRRCNTKTGSDTIREIIEYEPQMPQNLQKQINIMTSEILNGGFQPNMRMIPIYIAENIKNISDGAIKLDITDYCEETLGRSRKKFKENSNRISLIKRTQHFTPTKKEFYNKIETIIQKKLLKYLKENKNSTLTSVILE